MDQDRLFDPAYALAAALRQLAYRIVLTSFFIVSTSNRLNAVKEVLLLHSDHIRKLVLDLPTSHLRLFEAELSGVFPILADVSISVRLDHTHISFDEIPKWKPAATPYRLSVT